MDLVHLHTVYLIISILLNRLQSCCKLLNLLYLVFCHLLNFKVLFRFSTFPVFSSGSKLGEGGVVWPMIRLKIFWENLQNLLNLCKDETKVCINSLIFQWASQWCWWSCSGHIHVSTRSLILASLLSSSTVRSILETSAFDAASLTFSIMTSVHALSSTMLFIFFHCHWGVIDWSNTGSLIFARSTTACLNSLPKETKVDGR